MTQMQINGSDRDTLRLFHLDLPREAVERFVTQAGTGEWPLKYALGATRLRPTFVDIIDIRDLGRMPLSAYLAEAHGATGADFAQMRPQIDALQGHAVALPAQAFDNTSQALSIAMPLRWIGTFGEVRPRAKGPALRSASAKGAAGSGAGAAPGFSGRWPLVLAAAGVLLVLAVLWLVMR